MSEASFHEPRTSHSPANGDVDHKLQLSAMLFSDLDFQSSLTETESGDPGTQIFNDTYNTLEEHMEEEGLRYVGGYIVRKFEYFRSMSSLEHMLNKVTTHGLE